MTWRWVAAMNVMLQDDHERSRITAPNPRPPSKSTRSKDKRDRAHLVGLDAAHALRGDKAAAREIVAALLEAFPDITIAKLREEALTTHPRIIDSRERNYAVLRGLGPPA
jgi:hypothetical protein